MNTLRCRIWVGATVLLLSASCAKDRTVDDWWAEQYAQELAKIQAISGTYKGSLYSMGSTEESGNPRSMDGAEDKGPFSFSIEPDTRVSDARDRPSTQQQASVKGQITLSNQRKRVLAFRGGSYKDGTGEFSVNIPVKQTTGDSVDIVVTGTIKDGRFKGKIQASTCGDYSDCAKFGGIFDLALEGPSSEDQPLSPGEAGKPSPADPFTNNFTGQVKKGGLLKEGSGVEMVIRNAQLTSEQDFLYFFLPVKRVTVNMNIYVGTIAQQRINFMLLFENAQLDPSVSGFLWGSGYDVRGGANGERIMHSLVCSIEASTVKARSWKCSVTNGSRIPLFENAIVTEANPSNS